MDLLARVISVVIIAYTLMVLYAHLMTRRGRPLPGWLRLRKLEPMRKFWGNSAGTAIHIFGYVIVPLSIGIGLLLFGWDAVAWLYDAETEP
jgi:hypothetical protein